MFTGQDVSAMFEEPAEVPGLGTKKKNKVEDTEDREGREAGNGPHFLRQDTVFLQEASWNPKPQRPDQVLHKNTLLFL